MSTKPVFPCALLLALVGASLVRAQPPSDQRATDYRATPPNAIVATTQTPNMTGVNEVPPPTEVFPPPNPDKWMCYTCPDCCGPMGKCGPVRYELFLRSGPALNIGGGTASGVLASGWMFEAGGRSLFFDADPVRAWTVELSVSDVYNHGNRPNIQYIFGGTTNAAGTPVPNLVSTASLNRTYGNVSGGREWWLIGMPFECGWRWRAGVDGGFRYGTCNHDMHNFNPNSAAPGTTIPGTNFGQISRNGSITYGPFAAIHSDIEFPCNCCTYLAGVRAEWDYSRMNVIPLRNNDIYDLNLMLNIGVRY
jgi:hypothetical protein